MAEGQSSVETAAPSKTGAAGGTVRLLYLPDRWYYTLFLCVVLLAWVATILLLNGKMPPQVISALHAVMEGYGDPSGWVNSSVRYRERMASVYYLVLLLSIVAFGLGLVRNHESEFARKVRESSLARKIIGSFILVMLFFGLFQGIGADHPLSIEELEGHRLDRRTFNNAIGVIALETMILGAAVEAGMFVMALLHPLIAKLRRNRADTQQREIL